MVTNVHLVPNFLFQNSFQKIIKILPFPRSLIYPCYNSHFMLVCVYFIISVLYIVIVRASYIAGLRSFSAITSRLIGCHIYVYNISLQSRRNLTAVWWHFIFIYLFTRLLLRHRKQQISRELNFHNYFIIGFIA